MRTVLDLEKSGPYPIDGDLRAARALWREACRAEGYATVPNLTSVDVRDGDTHNVKLAKNRAPATVSLTLMPADASGILDMCPWRTPDCTLACVLVTAGNAVKYRETVERARRLRTRFLAEHPAEFILILASELRAAAAKYATDDEDIVARLNVAADARWERIAPDIFTIARIRFYDYSKAPMSQRDTPDTYRIAYSVSERPRSVTNGDAAVDAGRSAVVVLNVRRGEPMPASWRGRPAIDGDETDDRSSDPNGVFVLLRAKGSAVGADDGGFVKRVGIDG
jgi:hypothetical protein